MRNGSITSSMVPRSSLIAAAKLSTPTGRVEFLDHRQEQFPVEHVEAEWIHFEHV